MPSVGEVLKADPLLLALGAILVMALTAKQIIDWATKRKANGNGNGHDERRKDYASLNQSVTKMGNDLTDVRIEQRSISGRVDAIDARLVAIDHRMERWEETSRKGDTQTARELGSLGGTLEALAKIIGQGFRSPPEGIPRVKD